MNDSYQIFTRPRNQSQLQTLYIQKEQQLIPVIFLPGVMGSNLKDKNGRIVWRAETNSVDGVVNLLGWALPYFGSAKVRRKDLNPESVLVDNRGSVAKANKKNNDELAFGPRSARGWGTVANMSYGEFLPWLQEHLYCAKGNLSEVLNKLKGEPSFKVDEQSDYKLSFIDEQIQRCNHYALPVHAMGYNWLASIESSAAVLKKLIDEQLPQYYRTLGKEFDKVILVTHSMGGLVARYYTQVLNGQDKVYGVVHGVLPSTGAPAAYTRMKQGAGMAGIKGKIISEVIGDDAAEMTAVCSQSPGPLQLLPSPEYGTHWLTITHSDGRRESYPQADPYEEVYLEKAQWWGLCEPHLINPANTRHDLKLMAEDWRKYSNIIKEDVQTFHHNIADRYHPNTYAFYGIDIKQVNNIIAQEFLTYESVHWQGKRERCFSRMLPTKRHLGDERRLNLHELGAIRRLRPLKASEDTWQEVYTLQKATDNGDSTVPTKSGEIPIKYLKSRLSLDIGHEPAYNDKEERSQEFTLRAIINMIQEV